RPGGVACRRVGPARAGAAPGPRPCGARRTAARAAPRRACARTAAPARRRRARATPVGLPILILSAGKSIGAFDPRQLPKLAVEEVRHNARSLQRKVA